MSEHVDGATFVSGLGNKVLHCRELGHSWKPLTASWDRDARAYDRRLRCTSCRTIRVQLLTEYGHVVSNRYIYPEGYLAKGVNVGTLHRDQFRLEALTRFLSATTEVAS